VFVDASNLKLQAYPFWQSNKVSVNDFGWW
jgi:hypothetical protein